MSLPLATDDSAREVAKGATKDLLSIRTDWHVWDDFLEATLATLDSQFDMLVALRTQDAEAFREADRAGGVFETMAERRPKEHLEIFGQAYGRLALAASDAYTDALGYCHENWQSQTSKKLSGQYFTPHGVCGLMVRGQIQDPGAMLCERAPARARDAMREALDAKSQKEGLGVFIHRVLPRLVATGGYEPITICDPACGSGRFLLAAAAHFPRWAVQFGLLQLYGQDIDRRCAQMARINARLYGLNGYGAEMMAAAGQLPMQALRLVAVLRDTSPASTDAAETPDAAATQLPPPSEGEQLVMNFSSPEPA